KWIWDYYGNTSLEKAKKSIKESYSQLRKIIIKHTNDELFEKKRYKWTGTTSLGSYLISATSSHYDWAFKLIKRAKANRMT
ncbi:MAG: ClbS/DfsB family four-helix bundle protein, partial [Bacteroidota bacterium]